MIKSRLCKFCGDWHDTDEPLPEACIPWANKSQSDFPTPYVVGDIEEYRSPIDGKLISSRSSRREDLKANGCVEWEPGVAKTSAQKGRVPGKYKNPRFARKWGLPLSEEGRQNAAKMASEHRYSEKHRMANAIKKQEQQ